MDRARRGVLPQRAEGPAGRRSQLAHEYGAIAHDLARAVEHARNAAILRPARRRPARAARTGREGRGGEARRELTRAYERLREGEDGSDAGPKAKFYRDAAGELYRAARRDFEAGRTSAPPSSPAPPRP